MVEQMQQQAMYPKRRLYCNKGQNLKAKHKWECGLWLSAEERHKDRQMLCKWLLDNCNPCEEYIIRVVLMVRIHYHSPDAKERKPDAGATSVIYKAMRRKNKRHGIIASGREVCNSTRCLGDRSRLILHQRVWGSARAVSAIQNTRVFQTETRVVADASWQWREFRCLRWTITLTFSAWPCRNPFSSIL
jgi:hypothetical protein